MESAERVKVRRRERELQGEAKRAAHRHADGPPEPPRGALELHVPLPYLLLGPRLTYSASQGDLHHLAPVMPSPPWGYQVPRPAHACVRPGSSEQSMGGAGA